MKKFEKKVAENEVANFYTNFLCNTKGKISIFLAENKKTKEKDYLLVYKNKPIFALTSIAEIYIMRDIFIEFPDLLKKQL